MPPKPFSLPPVSRSTLSEQMAKRLAARITSGEWRPGEKLPSEAELCKAFEVGRSSLREALTSLAFIGLIRMRAGGGSYVAEHPSGYFTSQLLNAGLSDKKQLGEFVEARLVLEIELAGLCAERVTPEELAEMGLLMKQMKVSVNNVEAFAKLDQAFHLAIGKAANNEVLNNLLKNLREQTMDVISKNLLSEEGKEQTAQEHAKILEALRQHNPAKAREAMRYHLESFQHAYDVLSEEQP
jgi:GntR family transcriptional repressor for pyruvate dehydrogenase complex